MVIKVAIVGLGVTVAVGGVVTATVATQAAAATHSISREISASEAPATVPASADHAALAYGMARGNVGVTVPRVTFIRVDARGRVLRIWTNTGELPQRGDRFVIRGAGATHAASTRLVKEIL